MSGDDTEATFLVSSRRCPVCGRRFDTEVYSGRICTYVTNNSRTALFREYADWDGVLLSNSYGRARCDCAVCLQGADRLSFVVLNVSSADRNVLFACVYPRRRRVEMMEEEESAYAQAQKRAEQLQILKKQPTPPYTRTQRLQIPEKDELYFRLWK